MKSIFFFPFLFLICGVIGVDADKVKTVSVMEGDSVTLNPDLTQIQGIDLILWRFGASGSRIAETVSGKEILYPNLAEIFGGRLQLDHQTGSLTIKNMRIKHSGLYKLEINHNNENLKMTFNITVSDSPPVIDFEMKNVMEGDSVILQTDVTETHRDELIVWRLGVEGKLLAKSDIETKSSKLYYETDERFRGRLMLDHQTGSLIINNTRTTDSELYTVKISSSSKQTIYKRFNVSVSEAATEGETSNISSHVNEEERIGPCSGLSSGAVAGIFVFLLLVFAAAAAEAVVIYHCRKISKQRQMVKEGESVTLKTDAEIQNNDSIDWIFRPEETCIAERAGANVTYNSVDARVRGRTTDSGDYKLQIVSNSVVSNKKLSVITGSSENGVNESVTVDIPLLSKEDVDRVREQEATGS